MHSKVNNVPIKIVDKKDVSEIVVDFIYEKFITYFLFK